MVAGDKDSNHLLYFKEYYNAVIAERILERDQENRMYNYDDAVDTIQYGNHELYKKHLIRATTQQLKNVLSKRARKAACQIDKDVDKCDYTFAKIVSNIFETKFIIKSNNNDYYTIYNNPDNFLLMRQLLSCDSKGEQFDTDDWNAWAKRSVDDKVAFLQRLKYVETPVED